MVKNSFIYLYYVLGMLSRYVIILYTHTTKQKIFCFYSSLSLSLSLPPLPSTPLPSPPSLPQVLDRGAQMDKPCAWLEDVYWDNITELDK